MALRLAALVAIFVANHTDCLGPYDYCTIVPSAARVALADVVMRIRVLAENYQQVLGARQEAKSHVLDPDQYFVTRQVTGDRVLLLDDTFTTGSAVFSTASVLRDAGAHVMGPLVIGRHIQRSWAPSADLLGWIERREWDERRCARCGGQRRDDSTLF